MWKLTIYQKRQDPIDQDSSFRTHIRNFARSIPLMPLCVYVVSCSIALLSVGTNYSTKKCWIFVVRRTVKLISQSNHTLWHINTKTHNNVFPFLPPMVLFKDTSGRESFPVQLCVCVCAFNNRLVLCQYAALPAIHVTHLKISSTGSHLPPLLN